jgi:hypothetical protein
MGCVTFSLPSRPAFDWQSILHGITLKSELELPGRKAPETKCGQKINPGWAVKSLASNSEIGPAHRAGFDV